MPDASIIHGADPRIVLFRSLGCERAHRHGDGRDESAASIEHLALGGVGSLGAAPQILKGKVSGGTLQVAAAQKGTGNPVALNAPLLRIALDLKPSQSAGAVSLASDATKGQVLDGSGALVSPITVSVGTLTAQ